MGIVIDWFVNILVRFLVIKVRKIEIMINGEREKECVVWNWNDS